MPLLSFDIYANYAEVTRLRQEITMLENRLKSLGPGTSTTTIHAIESHLRSARSQFNALTMEAANAGAALELNIRKGANGAIAALNDLQSKLTNPIQGLAQIAGVAGLGLFLNQVKNIRGEFQQMESAINTLVGETKGKELMSQLTDFAKVSPLDFKGTVSGAQMMLGFGVDADKVPRYLSAIGDVAMGDARRFQSLTLAFSQMSAAGKLMGQDLNQMINAGFNPLQTMADKTGKSIAALKEEMSQGKITAEMVQQAFIDATSAGGKYYGMSEKASQTIGGQMSMLQDATDLMFNDLGKGAEGAIIKVIEGATKLIENYDKIGPVLGKAVLAFGVYKASAMASDFAVRKQAEDSTKAIVEGFNEQIAKLEELKRAKTIDAYDSDIKDAINTGAITQEKGAQIQSLRDEIRLEEEVAKKAKEVAEAQLEQANKAKDAADIAVESAQKKKDAADEHLNQAMESLDLQEISKAREAQTAAQTALSTAEKQRESAAIAVASAERVVETTNTELNTAAERANTAAEIQNTTATNTNTAAQNTNTSSVSKGCVATALSTAGQKAATVATHLWTAATIACKKAWDSLKLAIASNPIGMVLTAATALWSVFSSIRDDTEETSAEVERFGESAVKARRDVDTLYAVLASCSSSSKVYQDALSELEKKVKDYGIVLDNESDKYEQLITQREKLIKLIKEEGRQRQTANQIEAFQKKQQNATDEFISKMTESIKDESKGDAKDHADDFANIIASTIDAKEKELTELIKQLESLEQKKLETAKYDYNGNVYYDQSIIAQIAETQAAIAMMANTDAKKFAKELGIGSDYILDIKDTCGFVSEYLKASSTNAKFLAMFSQQAAESQAEIEANKIKQPFDPSLFSDLDALFKDYDARIQKINDTPVEPQANTEQIDAVTESATEAQEGVENLDVSSAEPTTDTGQIDDVTASADNATTAMGVLDSTKATPFINSSWVTNFSTKLNEAWVGLQKLMGVENSTPLINTDTKTPAKIPAQQKQDLTQAFHDDITHRINAAKTTEDFEAIRKSLNARLKKTDQSSSEYTWLEKQIKALDKRDKSKKNKNGNKYDPKQKAWEIAEAQRKEDERLEADRIKELQRKEDLRIEMMRDGSDKEIATIHQTAEKKRQALIDERKKEAERLKEFDRQQWFKGGKDRKAYQWTQTKSDEEYLREAGINVGYDTQLNEINWVEETSLRKVQHEIAATMMSFLKDYGTFQQKRYAIEQQYASKTPANDAERRLFDAQKQAELQKLDIDAIKQQIDWGSMFGDFGAMLSDQVQPTIERLQAITKTKEFRESSFEEQKAVFEMIETLQGSITKWDSDIYSNLGTAITDYQSAMAANTQAMNDESEARRNAEEAAERLRQIEEQNEQARRDGQAVNMDAENQARQESEEALAALNTAADHTKQTTTDLAQAQQTLSTTTSEMQNQFSQFTSGIKDLASGSLEGVWNGMNQLSKLFTGEDNLANKFGGVLIKGVQKLFGDDSKIGKEVSAALSSLGGPMMGEIVGMFFSILDILKDGIGNFIASLIDTVLGAVNGLLNSVLSGEIVTSVGKSVLNGVGNILDTVSFGGFSSLMNSLGLSGESDKNLEKDIERLTNTNDALRRAVDNLADVMQDSAVAEAADIYAVQKSNIEQSMANTQEMMSRAGAAYSNGFLGIGGKHSSNKKINDAMSKNEWARISKIVGKSVTSAADFWNLTSEQMAKVAQDAPDLYGKIKQYADDGHKDAAQFMDEYIEYYKELEELENAYRERLTDVSIDSVKDEFKSMLLDMESDAEDFAESFEKLMQQAIINSLLSSSYNKRIQEWYDDFASAMEGDDATITAAEQARLKREWDDIVADAVEERDRIKSTIGWDGSQTQQSSSRTLAGMSQDTGEAIEGRLTALQIAVESIRANGKEQSISMADLTDAVIEGFQRQYTGFNTFSENIQRQMAKCYIELQGINENTGLVVKPIQTMQSLLERIEKNTKNL